MISTVIDLCKSVIQYVRNEGELRLETRLRVSGILEEMSSIIKDTAVKLERDEYPHYNCVLMENFANQLHFHLIDHVKPNELDELHKQLINVSQVEKQFAVRKEPDTIPELYKVAAELKTISLIMKF